jgi:hypothetical protein
VFVWSFFSNNTPWQYIAIRIVIRLSCIAIYLLPYRDSPNSQLNNDVNVTLCVCYAKVLMHSPCGQYTLYFLGYLQVCSLGHRANLQFTNKKSS